MKKMKTKELLFIVSLLITTLISGCKSSEVDVPFSKFRTDKKYLRAVGLGISPDLAIAKKIALHNAKAELAGSIQSTFNEVNTTYFEQYGKGSTPDLSQKIEGMSQDISAQVLSNIRVADQKFLKVKKTNNVQCFVAIEMSKADVGQAVLDAISKAKKKKIDIEEDEYRKIFEAALDNDE
jgi:hypothetical protein